MLTAHSPSRKKIFSISAKIPKIIQKSAFLLKTTDHQYPPLAPIPKKTRSTGFTLVEAVFAIMIVGLGVVAMMQLFATGSDVNASGNEISSATFLAQQIRSLTDSIPYNALLACNGLSWNGADAEGNPIPGLSSYTQNLAATGVNPDDLTLYVGPDPDLIRLTVTVTRNGRTAQKLTWLRAP